MRAPQTLKNPAMEAHLFRVRMSLAVLVVLVLFAGLGWRYYDLQINRHYDFAALAENNRIQIRAVPAARGLIFDRNGVLLAGNRPGFTLSVVVERSEKLDELLAEINQLIPLKGDELERFSDLVSRRRPYESVPLRFNLSEHERSVLAVNEHRLAGIEVSARLIRNYPLSDKLAHVIGYTGRINDRELKNLNPELYRGQLTIGKTGLEKYYESALVGKIGFERVETNARGRVMRVLERIDPVPGQELRLYIDSQLQDIAYTALGRERGAVVALELATGGVLAMASTPSFDPNLFVQGISHDAYSALTNSADRPLFDRAVRGQYPPGSTVKPVFGLAALGSGVISTSYKIFDPGFYRLDNEERKYRDWKKGGHGSRVNFRQAIVESCDTYFYDIGFKMGIDALHQYGEAFGMGVPSGVDLPAEASGNMPSRAWKRDVKGLAWYPGDTVNVSIGQGFMLTTPLQLAVVASNIATRGHFFPPRLVDTGSYREPDTFDTLPLLEAHWQAVSEAMVGVVHDVRGTASRAVTDLGYKMAGKTGTAQVVGIKQDEEYDAKKMAKLQLDHALFIAFAPADNPRIAVAVVVENGEHGSSTAAPIARAVIDSYLLSNPGEESVGSG